MHLKLTKFVHSCVLVEYEGQAVLFDPGDLSWNSGIDVNQLPALQAIAITHEHADHFYEPFLEALLQKSPEAAIVTTESIAQKLQGRANTIHTQSVSPFEIFHAPHENLPFNQPGPQNVGIHFAGIFSHPGDSHTFEETKQVLAMPMTAPWGSMVGAVDVIMKLKPKYVLPIHDWHWRPEALVKFTIVLQPL